MFTAESITLLAKDARRRTGRTQLHFVNQDDGPDDTITIDGGGIEDPNDATRRDDSIRTEPVQCVLLLPPAAQSEKWWAALVLGRAEDAVSPQDALVALAHVAYRLGYARANIGNVRTEPVTARRLHETVEALYGAAGWTALVECWQEAAGIQQPKRQPKTDCASIPAAAPHGKPETPLPLLPSDAPLLEEGLYRALPAMPKMVQAFLLYQPKPPPTCRYLESEGERAERQALENLGAWTG
jgi:hypothetical protein